MFDVFVLVAGIALGWAVTPPGWYLALVSKVRDKLK
jgi:hypothetical protein